MAKYQIKEPVWFLRLAYILTNAQRTVTLRFTPGAVCSFFKLPGSLTTAFFVSLFSQHQFLQYFLQLCVSAQSQWTYCTLFALTSQSPTGKQWLDSLRPGTVLERSQTCQAMVLQFHHRVMLPQCQFGDVVWEVGLYAFSCVCAYRCWQGVHCGFFFHVQSAHRSIKRVTHVTF